MILVGSMPSELDGNSTYPGGIPGPGAVIVRAEEALLVILVLLLWAAAIALFFNRWGKIRMLEPYQPKFQQQHRQSCTTIDQTQLQNRRTYSKCNVHCDYPAGDAANVTGQARPRQNSVFTGSSLGFTPSGQVRRTKSALDLQSVVLTEDNGEQDTVTGLRNAGESTKLLQRDQGRRTSACQFDKAGFRDRGMSICHLDTSPRTWRRNRGMSICQFDRMDVLARPLQRERGMSICHFDRMDVLARPLQRDRIGSAYHFDRTEVRPNLSLGKSHLRERRVSVCNFLERDEEVREVRERRSSFGNFDKSNEDADKIERADERISSGKAKRNSYQQDPCCSKNSDVVFGYKATCV